jgi:CheY-like chemotaxis protein
VQSLRRLGFRLAVDDLGAGYAGLASFVGLEPEVVKIDMSLVRGIHREPVKRRLVTSIVELCRDLGTLVVAEGIETPDEREVLADIGCDLLQGYALGRPEPHPRETPTGPAPEKGRETILVVEDSASLREMIGEILAGASYDVIEASDPGEALLRAGDAGASFDLVLTDVELPELRGPELVARLRRTGSRARVLYMSGYNAVRGESLSEPGADFIQKPFPAGALLQKIRSLLDAPGP